MYCLPYVSFSDPECVYDFHIEEDLSVSGLPVFVIVLM